VYLIPKHSSCLPTSDYLPYLTTWAKPRSSLVDGFRNVWADRFPSSKLYPTPTGRHALWYFLETINLQAGDEVLVAAYNFYVIIRLILQKGLVPIFVDIDSQTLCMDADDLAKKITKKSRLVLVTHMFGNPAEMIAIKKICLENKLLLFEDCAHAVGTLCNTESVGQFGDGALFSFGVQKLINSFGGGMLVLSNKYATDFDLPLHSPPRLASTLDTFSRALTSFLMHPALYGFTLYSAQKAISRWENKLPQIKAVIDPAKDNPDYRFREQERAPYQAFMSEMHRTQLVRLDANINRRREIVALIKGELQSVDEITLLDEDKHGRSNCSYFGIYVPDPFALSNYLSQNGVDSGPQEYYDCASLGQFSAFAINCDNAKIASQHILRLPSYPWMRDTDIENIISTIKNFLQKIIKRS